MISRTSLTALTFPTMAVGDLFLSEPVFVVHGRLSALACVEKKLVGPYDHPVLD